MRKPGLGSGFREAEGGTFGTTGLAASPVQYLVAGSNSDI